MNRRSLLLAAPATLALGAFGARPALAQQAQITGAGATFPNPIYQKWAEAGRAANAANISLNYQSVGSGAGQAQIRNRTVDFGASDAPMDANVLRDNALFQFPTVMGSLVPVVNLDGIADNDLKMTGELVADIYLGKVTRWNDPRIVAQNPGVRLPSTAIAPVYRADGSGTTYVWVSYLSKVSEEWKTRVGVGTSVRFPAGTGARGNEGVAGTVRNTRGTIGYVENAYAIQNRMVGVQLRNNAGNYVKAENATFLAAAESADWTVANFAADLVETAGPNAWPIVSPTFIIVPKAPNDAARATNVLRFFDWAYRSGDALAQELEYIPMPSAVKDAVRAAWGREIMANGQPIWPAR